MAATSELAAIVGDQYVVAPPPAEYLHDATITRGLRGQAAALVRPADAEEARQVVARCYEGDVPIVPRGGGSGLAGGAGAPRERAGGVSPQRPTPGRAFQARGVG